MPLAPASDAFATVFGVNEFDLRNPVHLGGHPGELVRAEGRTLVWQGEMTPTLLSDLMRSGSAGPIDVQGPDEEPRRAWIQRCWFDLDRGRLVVHLLDRGMVA